MSPYTYPVLEYRVIDGDSIEVHLDQGFHCTIRQSCRLFGIDTPERHSDAGKAVTAVVESVMQQHPIWHCCSLGMDKYAGRFVGELFVDELNLGEWLLAQGLAREYHGGRKSKWQASELDAIVARCQVIQVDSTSPE